METYLLILILGPIMVIMYEGNTHINTKTQAHTQGYTHTNTHIHTHTDTNSRQINLVFETFTQEARKTPNIMSIVYLKVFCYVFLIDNSTLVRGFYFFP